MKQFRNLILLGIVLILSNLSCNVYAQYQVGDYYVKGNVRGIVFFVNNDEGILGLIKTEMEGRYEDYVLGDRISWRDEEFIIENANKGYYPDVWDIPNARMARLIHQNNKVISEASLNLGYKKLPINAFYRGKVEYDAINQRLIPIFWPRYDDDDFFDTSSEGLLLDGDRGKTGIILCARVNYRTGELLPIE